MRPASTKNLRVAAFTLVELLVVLTIAALLIAMLMPAIGKARESARATVCASQLRQQAIAVNLYCHDERDGAFPWALRFSGAWMVRMTPYLGTKFYNGDPEGPPGNWTGVRAKFPIFICPETKSLPGGVYYNGNYGMNVELTCGRNDLSGVQKDNAWIARRTLYGIRTDPSLIVLTNDNNYVTEVNGWQDITANLTYAYPRVHFQRMINIQFVDAHVALIAKGQRSDLTVKDAPGTGW